MIGCANRGDSPKGRFHRLLVGQPQRVGDRIVQPVAQLNGWHREWRGKDGEGGFAFFRVSPVALFFSREGQERVAIPLGGLRMRERHRLAILIFLAVGLIGLLFPIVVRARVRKGG